MQIDDTLGYMICRTARKVHHRIGKIFSPYGLTMEQWVAMKKLAEHPGISQKHLAERMEKDQNTVKAIVDRRIRKRYVQRRVNPSDRRAFLLLLTEEGQRQVKLLSVEDERENLLLEECLGCEETRQIKAMLRMIEERLAD